MAAVASPSTCKFAAFATIVNSNPSTSDVTKTNASEDEDDSAFRHEKDLLVALSCQFLHVFVRKVKSVNCSCHSPNDPVHLAGFQCPHLCFYDDFWQVATIPLGQIVAVVTTYRTTTNTHRKSAARVIATRTKDLILRFANGSSLWLEFEHNLSRGSFLDALLKVRESLVAKLAGSLQTIGPLEIDQLDLNEHEDTEPFIQHQSLDFDCYPALPIMLLWNDHCDIEEDEEDEIEFAFVFQREALRLVMYGKHKLVLAILAESGSSSSSSREQNDEMCRLLAKTALEMANQLDEPDLHALALIMNGCLLQFSQSTSMSSILTGGILRKSSNNVANQELALKYIERSLEICQQNSFDVLNVLATACCSDVYAAIEDYALALRFMTSALATVSPAIEVPFKMRIHHRINYLRIVLSQGSQAVVHTDGTSLSSSTLSPTRRATSLFPSSSSHKKSSSPGLHEKSLDESDISNVFFMEMAGASISSGKLSRHQWTSNFSCVSSPSKLLHQVVKKSVSRGNSSGSVFVEILASLPSSELSTLGSFASNATATILSSGGSTITRSNLAKDLIARVLNGSDNDKLIFRVFYDQTETMKSLAMEVSRRFRVLIKQKAASGGQHDHEDGEFLCQVDYFAHAKDKRVFRFCDRIVDCLEDRQVIHGFMIILPEMDSSVIESAVSPIPSSIGISLTPRASFASLVNLASKSSALQMIIPLASTIGDSASSNVGPSLPLDSPDACNPQIALHPSPIPVAMKRNELLRRPSAEAKAKVVQVTCALCQRAMSLEEMETHSDVCF